MCLKQYLDITLFVNTYLFCYYFLNFYFILLSLIIVRMVGKIN